MTWWSRCGATHDTLSTLQPIRFIATQTKLLRQPGIEVPGSRLLRGIGYTGPIIGISEYPRSPSRMGIGKPLKRLGAMITGTASNAVEMLLGIVVHHHAVPQKGMEG
jgi:hypothetical protein